MASGWGLRLNPPGSLICFSYIPSLALSCVVPGCIPASTSLPRSLACRGAGLPGAGILLGGQQGGHTHVVQVGKLRLRESGFQLNHGLLPAYQRGRTVRPRFGPPGSPHLSLVFESLNVLLGAPLGIWCDPGIMCASEGYSPREPIFPFASKKCCACFPGRAVRLRAGIGVGLGGWSGPRFPG